MESVAAGGQDQGIGGASTSALATAVSSSTTAVAAAAGFRVATDEEMDAMSDQELETYLVQLQQHTQQEAAAKALADEAAAREAADTEQRERAARRKRLLEEIQAKKMELAALGGASNASSVGAGRELEEGLESLATTPKDSASGKKSYRDMDGNVFLVNETKEASSHLERSQAFRRMMMKERLSYLTSREGMEINLSKLRDQLRSNSGHSMMIFGWESWLCSPPSLHPCGDRCATTIWFSNSLCCRTILF